MNVLVTGASGFIGRATVKELLERGHLVTTLHRGPALHEPRADHVAADICSAAARSVAERAESIVHLAGLGDVEDSFSRPFEYNRVNAEGTLNLLEGARVGGARLLLASTQRIYSLSPEPIPEDGPLEPTSPYAYSKIAAESYCRQYAELFGVPSVILRFFSVYGPGQRPRGSSGVVAIFLDRALAGLPLEVHGRRRRDFTHVQDVARGIALALERETPPGSTYNVATGIGTSLLELARLACELTRSRSPILEQQGSADGRSPAAETVDLDLVADCTRARSELGYEPMVDLKTGLLSCIAGRVAHEGSPSAPR